MIRLQALISRLGLARQAASSTIREEIAQAFFVSAWASCQEEMEADTRGWAGQDLMKIAPATPEKAYQAADKFIAEIEFQMGKSIDDLYRIAVEAPGKHYRDPSEEEFGFSLAMQALGHGVSWNDNHPGLGWRPPSWVEFEAPEYFGVECPPGLDALPGGPYELVDYFGKDSARCRLTAVIALLAMELADAHKLLGLPPGAPRQEIQRKYTELIRKQQRAPSPNPTATAKIEQAYYLALSELPRGLM